jgi:hypothetical protein
VRDDSDLIDALEPNQLTAATDRPLPRRPSDRGALILLIALYLYTFVAIPMIIYAFIHAAM